MAYIISTATMFIFKLSMNGVYLNMKGMGYWVWLSGKTLKEFKRK